MSEKIHQHRLTNGLRLVAEPVPGAQSLAMSMLTPGGVAHEPEGLQGVAAMLAEIVCRGACGLDAKAHSDALDQLGVHRGTGVETMHLSLSATMIGSKLREALPLLVGMITQPMLAEPAIEPSRDLALQAIDSLEDEPQQRVFLELRQRHYPQPFGRSPLGQRKALETIDIQSIRDYWRATMVPGGSVLGFTGKFDWDALRGQVEELLGTWAGSRPEPEVVTPAARGHAHETDQTTQVHIGMAYDAPPEPDEMSILQRTAAAVLSGGMSGRLFTEVREKRGLCYSVYASYAPQKRRGAMLCYAGTTAPRAQETLDVMVGELRRLSEGVTQPEFERAIVGMKSRLVMQGESTGARARAIVSDQYVYGRPRTLDELAKRVDSVTLPKLLDYVRDHPPGAMTVVTIGPTELRVSERGLGSGV